MRLGHLALSQTVSSRSSSISGPVKWFPPPEGMFRFSHLGSRSGGAESETIGSSTGVVDGFMNGGSCEQIRASRTLSGPASSL